MHSSKLRGSDFAIIDNGRHTSYSDFFNGFSNLNRLGVVTPNGIDGVGTAALLIAYTTAFYDTYRATGESFFAYPNYYTFQSVTPLASYTMLDVWPKHKDVFVERDPVDLLNAINDRAINTLLLPDGEPTNPGLEQPQIESALRTMKTCYLYSADGEVADADLTIEVHSRPVIEWVAALFDDHDYRPVPAFARQKEIWLAKHRVKNSLKQSYRRITIDEALTRL
jgi:hypothetical protein